MGDKVKKCPHCGQNMMIYRRNIRKNMLWCLRQLWFLHKFKPVKVVDLSPLSNINSDFTKLAYWGLVEYADNNLWKITERGILFILGRTQIPKYKWIYDNKIQADPEDEINPLIYSWEISPQTISKQTVLADALRYPYEPRTPDLFERTGVE